MIRGLDVSEFQGNIDFKKVKNDGYDFVMVRAGFGQTNKDKYFSQNVNNATKYGLKVGAYYFVYACNKTEAINNADNFIKLLSYHKGKITYPVACDFEYDSDDYMRQCGITPTNKLRTEIVKAFCDRVEKAGYYVMNYENYDFREHKFNDTSRYDLWLAYYQDKPYTKCGMWQFTSTGKVNGIKGNVDLDIAYKNYALLIEDKKLNFVTPNQTENKPKETNTKPKETNTEPKDINIKVGDTVEVTNPIIYGTNKKFKMYYKQYKVLEVVGKRAVIGIGNTVTSAIDVKYLRKK